MNLNKTRTSKHYLVTVTQPDWSDHIAYLGTDFREARMEARRLVRNARRVVIRTRSLTTMDAAEVWYRIGLTKARIVPPQRYAYAFHLGRRTARLRTSV